MLFEFCRRNNVNKFLCSHGRDGSLKVWQLRPGDEPQMSAALPVEGGTTHRKDPWLLHSLSVNTLNFCAFSLCKSLHATSDDLSASSPAVVAVPGIKDGYIDIWELPSERRLYSVPPPPDSKSGMVMAIRLLLMGGFLYLLSAFESGLAAVQVLSPEGTWTDIYSATPHSQPILSLDVNPNFSQLFTSGADDVIAVHSIPVLRASSTLLFADMEEPKVLKTKHSGQQGLSVRNDGRIFATAGWDSRVRVYSVKTFKELAVLKWHKDGCYATAFSTVLGEKETSERPVADAAEAVPESIQDSEGLQDDDSLVPNIGEQPSGVVAHHSSGSLGSAPSFKQRREDETRNKHWLAAGSKDGKISLWEIY